MVLFFLSILVLPLPFALIWWFSFLPFVQLWWYLPLLIAQRWRHVPPLALSWWPVLLPLELLISSLNSWFIIIGGLLCGKISVYSSPCWEDRLHPSGTMEWNPLENVPKCKSYAVCKANKFMIEQISETMKDYKFEAKSENSFLKRQSEEHRKEIAELKHNASIWKKRPTI